VDLSGKIPTVYNYTFGVQTKLPCARRYGHLFLGVAYTWSKDLTTASGDTSFVRPDQYTRQANYGPSTNDRRQNFAINYEQVECRAGGAAGVGQHRARVRSELPDRSGRECLGSVAAEGVQHYGAGPSAAPRGCLQRVQPHAIQRHQQTVNYASYTNLTPTNLYLKADGTVNNINGFGTVNGARDPRIMQLVVRLQF